MDSTSIITQVNRDEEPLNTFPTADSGEFFHVLSNILLCKRPLKRPWFVDRKKGDSRTFLFTLKFFGLSRKYSGNINASCRIHLPELIYVI